LLYAETDVADNEIPDIISVTEVPVPGYDFLFRGSTANINPSDTIGGVP
jgi:hypothetical protein